MTQVTVDNSPVTVLLGSSETFTPAAGSVLDVEIAAISTGVVKINDGTQTQRVINRVLGSNKGSGEPNVDSISVIIDDSITVESGSNGGVYISGFEVN
jgi:hypothetical protein